MPVVVTSASEGAGKGAEQSAPPETWKVWFASIFESTNRVYEDDKEGLLSKLNLISARLFHALVESGEEVTKINLSQRQDGLRLGVVYAFVYMLVNFVARTNHNTVKMTRQRRDGKNYFTGGSTQVTLSESAGKSMRQMIVISLEPSASIATVGHGFLTWAHPFLAWVAFYFYSKVTRFEKMLTFTANLQSFLSAEDFFRCIFIMLQQMLTLNAVHVATAFIVSACYGVPLLFQHSSASIHVNESIKGKTWWAIMVDLTRHIKTVGSNRIFTFGESEIIFTYDSIQLLL